MRGHLIMRQHVHGYTSLSFKLPQATVNPEDLSFPSRTGRDGCPEGKKNYIRSALWKLLAIPGLVILISKTAKCFASNLDQEYNLA